MVDVGDDLTYHWDDGRNGDGIVQLKIIIHDMATISHYMIIIAWYMGYDYKD